MKTLSTTLPRGCLPWQGRLLIAALLTFRSLLTTAQLTIESVPAKVSEGNNVLLLIHNQSDNPQGYYKWFKGEAAIPENLIATYMIDTQEIIPGPANTNQVTIYPNGSLLFQKVAQADAGVYTLQTTNRMSQTLQGHGKFFVYYQVPQPVLQSTNPNVTVGDIIILSCIPHTTGVTIRWIFNNRELWILKNIFMSDDHHILAINPVRKQNAGEYQCEVSTPAGSSRSATIKVSVQ